MRRDVHRAQDVLVVADGRCCACGTGEEAEGGEEQAGGKRVGEREQCVRDGYGHGLCHRARKVVGVDAEAIWSWLAPAAGGRGGARWVYDHVSVSVLRDAGDRKEERRRRMLKRRSVSM